MPVYNYEFRLDDGNGKTRTLGYQFLIREFGIEKEILHGRPMSDGGTPQALSLKGLIEKAYDGVSVEVWFQGNQIF